MEMKRIQPSRVFAATSGGVGVVDEARCAHGDPILSFHLFSEQPGKTPDDIGILLPQCVAPELFGAALAYVQVADGVEAGERFLARLFSARDRALEQISAYQAEEEAHARACCEAGSRTGGREHTCRRGTASPA